MKKATQTRVAGVGTAVGAVFIGSILLGACQPGALPCTKDEEWKGICRGEFDGGPTGGTPSGSGGNVAKTGGSGGGSGGSGAGGGGGGDPVGAKKVECPDYPTVKEMDGFFQKRCSDQPVCHGVAAFSDFKMPDLYKRILTMKTQAVCIGAMPIADGSDPKKGAIWAKIQPMPVCPDMKAAGSPMPSGTGGPLSAVEKKCLESYLEALTKDPK